MEWRMTFMNDRSMKMMDAVIRFICNMLLLYFVLQSFYVYAAAIYVVMGIYVYFTSSKT